MNTTDRLWDSINTLVENVDETIVWLKLADDPDEVRRAKLELSHLREGVDAIYSKAALICIDVLREERRLQDELVREYERVILHPEDYNVRKTYLHSPELSKVQHTKAVLEEIIEYLVVVMRDIDRF